ncbi:MAG: translation initiation factor eIF-1A [Candidatus Aenigmarchaeota archaeon]|nr:translation initiation factor eIF-1A [Candidatus Aenigmarchaeota archaeon]
MEEEVIRVRRPREGEILGVIEANFGSNKFNVRCQDGKMRIARIPGRLRKRMWMRDGDAVLIKPWEIQGDTRADIVVRYTPTEAGWLRRKGFLQL